MQNDNLHWVVRLNWRNRTVAFALLFPALAIHLSELHAKPVTWVLTALQFLVYPQLIYWRARRAADPLRAEMQNLLIDAVLMGAWVAAWGFPLWISFALAVSVCLNLMIFEGMPGAGRAMLSMAVGATLSMIGLGLHFHPDTSLTAALICIITLSLYLLVFAYAGYERGVALRESRQQLNEQLEQITALQAQLRELADRDPLTGLFNRRRFNQDLQDALDNQRRQGGGLALVMIDIDHFKRINDEHGHPAGDRVLKLLADVLTSSVRSSDLICRYGGEEFLLALPDTTPRQAAKLAERLRAQLESMHVNIETCELRVTLSMGIAGFPVDGDTRAMLLQAADNALYAAKQGGRNRVMLSAGAEADPSLVAANEDCEGKGRARRSTDAPEADLKPAPAACAPAHPPPRSRSC
ncbi:MAG: diguanylate cyclase [Pseudoxanthomonas sp.]